MHRVGRTARAGHTGTAYSFFTKKDFMMAPSLIKTLKKQDDKEIEVPQQLNQYAFLALKTTCHDDRHFKRRWRKIADTPGDKNSSVSGLPTLTQEEKVEILGAEGAERLSNFGKPNSVKPKQGRKTVNVAELIKQRQLLNVIEDKDKPADGASALAKPVDSAPIVQFSASYMQQS